MISGSLKSSINWLKINQKRLGVHGTLRLSVGPRNFIDPSELDSDFEPLLRGSYTELQVRVRKT